MSELRVHKYPNLDGLRTLAAICVVFFHVLLNMKYVPMTQMTQWVSDFIRHDFGNLAKLFFVISGFVMCCGYYDAFKNGNMSLDRFYRRRYLRILPFFAILIGIDLIVMLFQDGGVSLERIYEAFSNLTLLYGFFANRSFTVIGVGWTLGVIFAFYIFFPFFVFLLWTRRRAWISLAISFGLLYVNAVLFQADKSIFLPWLCYFLIGGLLYLYRETVAGLFRHPAVGVLVTLLGLAVLLFVPTAGDTISAQLHQHLKQIVSFTLMVAGMLSRPTVVWSNPLTRFFGGISFEIYLSHMAVYRLLDLIGFTTLFGESFGAYLAVALGVTAVSVLCAWCYRKCEIKFSEIIRNRVYKQKHQDCENSPNSNQTTGDHHGN